MPHCGERPGQWEERIFHKAPPIGQEARTEEGKGEAYSRAGSWKGEGERGRERSKVVSALLNRVQ